MDLDGTLTLGDPGLPYAEKRPNAAVVARLRECRPEGFEIVVATARGMNTFGNSVGRIGAHTLPGIVEWLRRHGIAYDEIQIGKPWCGVDGFYVDDRAIRPSEFAALGHSGALDLLANELTWTRCPVAGSVRAYSRAEWFTARWGCRLPMCSGDLAAPSAG